VGGELLTEGEFNEHMLPSAFESYNRKLWIEDLKQAAYSSV